MFRFTSVLLDRVLSPKAALRVLRLKSTSSAELTHALVKKAYIQQTLQCHPDLFPSDPAAGEKFKELSDALRVVLKLLQSPGRGGQGGVASAAGARAMQGSTEVLEVLRAAIVNYHVAKEKEAAWRRDGSSSSSSSPHQSDSFHTSKFYSPSLEYVATVCRQEALALRRLRTFSDELPATLSGDKTVLFDTFVFFHVRYVEAMSTCVLRFSKNLPIIVRRIVSNRKKYIRYEHNQATSGIGTTTSPKQQKIESMSMKPLVLVGALVFDRPPPVRGASDSSNRSTTTSAASHSQSEPAGATHAEDDEEAAGGDVRSTSSAQGICSASEIQCCEELKCTIHPADSIDMIVKKMGQWEARSFSRLRVELAIAQSASLLSTMLGLTSVAPLSVTHNLKLSQDVAEAVSLTVQRLVCQMCLYDDSNGRGELGVRGSVGQQQQEEDLGAVEGGGDGAGQECVAQIERCRDLQAQVDGLVCGSMAVQWSDHTPLVRDSKDVTDPDSRSQSASVSGSADAGKEKRDMTPPFTVGRHPSCCSGETVLFAVTVRLERDLLPFLRNVNDALERVVALGEQAREVIPALVQLRDTTVQEEFILQEVEGNDSKEAKVLLDSSTVRVAMGMKVEPESFSKNDGSRNQQEEVQRVGGSSGVDDSSPVKFPAREPLSFSLGAVAEHTVEDLASLRPEPDVDHDASTQGQSFRYRGPIQCFPRIFNMPTEKELKLWELLHAHREYIAEHVPAMNALNLFYNCVPYQIGANGQWTPSNSTSNSSPVATASSAAPSPHSSTTFDGTGGSTSENPQVFGCWAGESSDSGSDNAIVTDSELSDPNLFKEWLEEVVEQSTLNRECQQLLNHAGVGYIHRSGDLPLENYLSFVKLFVGSAAVRSVLEQRAAAAAAAAAASQHHESGHSGMRVLSSEDIGLMLVVGFQCDVREGGRLFVPWHLDPSALLSLLEDSDAAPIFSITDA